MNSSINKYFLQTILLIVLMFLNVKAQNIIGSIRFEGNDKFSEDQLIEWTELKSGGFFDKNQINSINKKLINHLNEEGYFLSSEELKARYDSLLEGVPPSQIIVYCGSGVTSNLNLIGMVEAGYEMGLLYPGSWSEWFTDPDRPRGP